MVQQGKAEPGGADLSFLLSCPGSVAWVEAALAKIQSTNPLGDWDQFFFSFFWGCVWIVPSPSAADLASGY